MVLSHPLVCSAVRTWDHSDRPDGSDRRTPAARRVQFGGDRSERGVDPLLFACRETLWTVAISVLTVVINVVAFVGRFPSGGARTFARELASQSVQAVLLLMLTARLVSGIDWGALVISIGKIVVCSLAMLAALHWIGALGVTPEATLASRAWFLFGQIAIGGTVFIAFARMLDVEELDLAWHTIVARSSNATSFSPPENREAPIA